MNILLKTIGVICIGWVIICSLGALGVMMDGKVLEGILAILFFGTIPALIGFYAFKYSKRFTEKGKKELEEQKLYLEQQNEIRRKQREEENIRLANEKIERERLEAEENEKKNKQREEEQLRLANEKAEKERLETEKKEKEFQEFKNKYPDHWENILNKKIALDMTLEMVIMILGEAHNRKEAVTKTKTTEKYYFHPYKNAQKKTSYKLEVTFENGLVSGWKEL
jgi:hypothetical protein